MGISDRGGRLLLLTLAVLCAAGHTSSGNDEHVYRCYELEKLVAAEGWLTADFWTPSGGLFTYPLTNASPASVVVACESPDERVIWLRVRDETAGMRLARATVNGEESYIMGGTNGGQWVWYQVGVVEGDTVDLTLSHVRTRVQMDPWFDALFLTTDLSFVPPGVPPGKDGYATYEPAEDGEKGRRAAWIWWPAQPQPSAFAYYRKTFDLADLPQSARISVACLGYYTAYVNEQFVASSVEVLEAADHEIAHLCRRGANTLTFEVEHAGFLPGLRVDLRARLPDGAETCVVSDLTWRANDTALPGWLEPGFDDGSWQRPWARIGEREVVGYWDQPPPTE